MADNFEELSYNDLRKRCSELGLGTKGKKGDLVARLQEHAATENAEPAKTAESEPAPAASESPKKDDAAAPAADSPSAASKPAAAATANEGTETQQGATEPKEASVVRESTPPRAAKAIPSEPSPSPPRYHEDSPSPKQPAAEVKNSPQEPAKRAASPPPPRAAAQTRAAPDEDRDSKRARTERLTSVTPFEPEMIVFSGAAATAGAHGASDAQEQEQLTSPARAEETRRVVHIRDLVRPFTLGQLRDFLSQHGKLVESDGALSLDRLKTQCYAEFETSEDAKRVAKNIEGVRWPSGGKFLHVSLVEKNLLAGQAGTAAASVAQSPARARQPAAAREAAAPSTAATAVVPGDGDLRWQLTSRSRDARQSLGGASTAATQGDADREAGRTQEPDAAGDEGDGREQVGAAEPPPPVRQLDELFRKTTAKPSIYWLPVSDDIAQRRLGVGVPGVRAAADDKGVAT